MKILAALMVCLMLIFSALSLVASAAPELPTLAYGDRTSGVLNDDVYEWVYQFEGSVGDTILVDLEITANGGSVNANVMLIRPDGRYLYGNYRSQAGRAGVLAEIDMTGTYQIIVERQNLRRGYGEGEFQLSLIEVLPENLTSSWLGVLDNDVPFASQIFYIEETGVYRMSMGQAGEPNPAVILFAMIPGETQLHAIADFDAATEGVFSFEAELTGGLFYVAQFQQPSYQLPSVNNGQSFSVRYSFRITPVDEREPR